ncbi:hypothetical protein DRW03_10060 [Corallococcus sp. H22C18031201]|nr:hypothetical protein DRW03_10060 [Corallococcus sp. H22C18031201]
MTTRSSSQRGGASAAAPVRRLSSLALLAALAPLSGFAQSSVAPPSPAPADAPVSASAPASTASASAGDAAVTPAAARALGLRGTLALAAKQSPDVAVARAQAAVVRASVQRAWSAWLPELTASGQLVRTSAPSVLDLGGIFNGVGAIYGLPPPNPAMLPPPVPIVAEWSRYGTLQLSQPLFTPQGAFLISPAKRGAEAAELGAQEAREQILLGVARTYLGLQGIEQLIEAARDAENVALQREKEARALLDAGVSVEVALLRAQTDTAQARTQMAQLEGQRAQLMALLGALVGESIRPAAPGTDDMPWGALHTEDEQPWEQVYSVRSAAKVVESAEGVVTYDRFAWLPSLAAIAKGNYNSNSGFSGRTTSYDLILAITVPLYDRGVRYAAKHEDEAKLAQARASLVAGRAKARASWVAARANVQAAQAALAQADAQAQLAARAQKQVSAQAQAGMATNLEVTDADNRRFLAQSSAAQARATLEIRRAELAASEGGLAELALGAQGG